MTMDMLQEIFFTCVIPLFGILCAYGIVFLRKYIEDIKTQLENLNDKFENIQVKNNYLTEQLENIQIKNDNLTEQLKNVQTQNNNLNSQLTLFKEWQINFNRQVPNKYPIRLTDDEISLLCKYLQSSKNYLEFGSGGSTFLALINSVPDIYSVESDADWIEYLRTYKIIQNAEQNEQLKFHHVDIGKTKEWGYPADDSKRDNYGLYSSDIFNTIKNTDIDLVFIDGRFRVACAISAIMNCNSDIRIILHDYTIREYYKTIEKFLDIVESADTLVVFKPKTDLSKTELNEIYEQYKYVKE